MVGALLLAACGGGPPPGARDGAGTAPTPARGTPAETVRGFLAAVDAGGAAAAGYVTARFAARDARVEDPWLDGRPVRVVRIVSVDPAGFTGYARRHAAVRVTVELDLPHGGGGFRAGRNPWAFVVVRDGPRRPWLIDDQGLG